VTNLSDHDPGSLRDAIATTPAGGTVDFQPGLSGTITLTTGELAISEDLTISGPGASVLTVSGNHASRVFDITAPVTVAISGLRIADGSVPDATGGGIYNNGTLTVTSCTVSGNSAYYEGGIDNQGTLTLTNSDVSGNSAGFAAGAIGNEGTLTVTSCTINGNSSLTGGSGIYNFGGTATVTASTFSGNSADLLAASLGGGIANGSGTLTVTACILSGNSAAYGGGIIAFGTVTITDSTLSGNSAAHGGGIYLEAGALTVTNSTLSGNSADGDFDGGGGIFINGGMATITSSTLSGNLAPSTSGGGIALSGGNYASLRDTILAGNSASASPDLYGPLQSLGHNLIGDGTGGSGYDPTDLVGTSSNPIDPKLGPLQDNGGPTFTMALLPGSPAIDAGDPTDAPMWDQRGPGYPRVVNGMIDIGAFEHQTVAPTITCSVADPLLWPPNHRLVNVGLSVDVQPPDATVHVQVYANDNATSSAAADIGPGTLELRAARQGQGSGRVYLLVVTATAGGQTAFDVCTVVVPHDQSPGAIAEVQAAAAGAEAYYREFQMAPAGYRLLGEGPAAGAGTGLPTPAVASFAEVALQTPRPDGTLPGTVVAVIGPAAPMPAEVSARQSVQPPADGLPNFLAESRNAQDALFAAVGDPLALDLLAGP
jgi:hypothetical protein